VRRVVVDSIVDVLVASLVDVLHLLHRHDFDLLLSAVLNAVHPLRHVLCQSTPVLMHRPLALVGIVDVLVLVDHRMEVTTAVVGEVEVRLLHEERVFRGDDATVEHAVADRTMDVAVFVAEDVTLVDVARVDLSFALIAVFGVENLKGGMSDEFQWQSQTHLKIITKRRQVALQSQMKVLAVRGNLQMHMTLLPDRASRSTVLRVQVFCVVAQRLIMRYVFIQTFA
jgi:hypothetical protein